jgi:phosphoribosyl 1,2-cyclic phosphodiesterase
LRVHFCGVRGSLPAPGFEFARYGGNTPCVALAHDADDAPKLVLDAGTGLAHVSRLLDGRAYEGGILLTHLHWDHILGLPFFAAGDRADAAVRLRLPEQDTISDATSALAVVMSPPFFPIAPGELEGHWRLDTLAPGEFELEGFTVLAREVPHKGGRTYGYRVHAGARAIAYIPDHCPTLLGPGPDGLGEYHDAALELARDVDLLIHDAQLLPEELAAEAVYGHAAADYAVALGRHAGARAVALFHHRPNRTDDALDELGVRLRGSEPDVSVAVEGSTVSL